MATRVLDWQTLCFAILEIEDKGIAATAFSEVRHSKRMLARSHLTEMGFAKFVLETPKI